MDVYIWGADLAVRIGLNNAPEGQDDFRFCYAGVAGSFTPLHRDVCELLILITDNRACRQNYIKPLDTSYSWSTNIAGIKQWYLFPPEAAYLLRRNPSSRRSEMIYDTRDVDDTVFQGWKEAQAHAIRVEQLVCYSQVMRFMM